jgi:hypothetical protein
MRISVSSILRSGALVCIAGFVATAAQPVFAVEYLGPSAEQAARCMALQGDRLRRWP